MADRRIAEALPGDILRRAQAVLPVHEMGEAVGCNRVAAEVHATGRKVQGGVGVQMRGLPGQALRVERVVGVHAGQVDAARGGQTGIERLGDALMGTAEHSQPGFPRGRGLQQGRAVIRGAVVHGDHFKRGQGRVRSGALSP